MITKSQLKFVKSLQLKKNRVQAQCFLVEGAKSVVELLDTDYSVEMLLYTEDFIATYPDLETNEVPISGLVSEKQLAGLGSFKSSTQALAVAKMKANRPVSLHKDQYALALDDIRDPGNLGTIIRIADWYGIEHIIASETTAELYNPKVIQASMGSFTRVNVYYTHLPDFLQKYKGRVYGAFMEGQNIHQEQIVKGAILVIGNESHGISNDVATYIDRKVTIPRYGQAESLNAAIATAILCDNVFRFN